MRVDIWSDVVCPWCYIGKRRFEQALERFAHARDVEVVHRSFQLDPRAPPHRSEPTSQMLASKYGVSAEQAKAMMTRVEQTAAEVGLEYRLADTLSGNTTNAHRLIQLAKRRSKQDAVVERFFRAYFTEERSLFDADSLVELAAEAGLDADEARRALSDDSYAEEVAADEAEAHAIGATGVPFFVIGGRYAVSGAQPAELFLQALERAWNERGQPG